MAKVAEIKTKPTASSVADFINALPSEQKRQDANTILQLMQKATGETPTMWGASIIGFGNLRYKSPTSGREVDWFRIGFSPRKTALTLYMGVSLEKHAENLQKLGKHKTGMGCLYINKLADVDLTVLEKMIETTAKKGL